MHQAAHEQHDADAASQFGAEDPSSPNQHGGNQAEDAANRQAERTLGIRWTSTAHAFVLMPSC